MSSQDVLIVSIIVGEYLIMKRRAQEEHQKVYDDIAKKQFKYKVRVLTLMQQRTKPTPNITLMGAFNPPLSSLRHLFHRPCVTLNLLGLPKRRVTPFSIVTTTFATKGIGIFRVVVLGN